MEVLSVILAALLVIYLLGGTVLFAAFAVGSVVSAFSGRHGKKAASPKMA